MGVEIARVCRTGGRAALAVLLLGLCATAAPASPPSREEFEAHRDECLRGRRPMRVVERFGHELSGLDLTGISLSTSEDLPAIDFRGAELDELVLVGAVLDGVDLSHCRMRRVKAAGARLVRCSFDGSLIQGDFAGATLDGARFVDSHLVRCDFARASLVGVSFGRARIEETDFANATLRGARFDLAQLDDVVGITPDDLRLLDRENRERDEAALRYPAEVVGTQGLRWMHLAVLLVLGGISAVWTRRRYPGRLAYRATTFANATSALAVGVVATVLFARPAIGSAVAWGVWCVWVTQAAGAIAVALAALRLAAVDLTQERRAELVAFVAVVMPSVAHAAWVAIDLAAWAMRWGALGE